MGRGPYVPPAAQGDRRVWANWPEANEQFVDNVVITCVARARARSAGRGVYCLPRVCVCRPAAAPAAPAGSGRPSSGDAARARGGRAGGGVGAVLPPGGRRIYCAARVGRSLP